MTLPSGYGVVLHISAVAAFATDTPNALLAVDDADAGATAVLVPMLGYAEVYRRQGHTERGAELLDALLDIGVALDAPLDREAARGVALTAPADDDEDRAGLIDAETAWHARRRGWPVLAMAPAAARLTSAFPDLHILALPAG